MSQCLSKQVLTHMCSGYTRVQMHPPPTCAVGILEYTCTLLPHVQWVYSSTHAPSPIMMCTGRVVDMWRYAYGAGEASRAVDARLRLMRQRLGGPHLAPATSNVSSHGPAGGSRGPGAKGQGPGSRGGSQGKTTSPIKATSVTKGAPPTQGDAVSPSVSPSKARGVHDATPTPTPTLTLPSRQV